MIRSFSSFFIAGVRTDVCKNKSAKKRSERFRERLNKPRGLPVKTLALSAKAKKEKCKERGIQGQMRRFGDGEIGCQGGEMKFTESLWVSIEDIYDKILKHPFIQKLIDGSLDEEVFRFYVVQDALYLRDYARGLALLGIKAPHDQWLMMFVEHARDVIVVERALHESFFKDWQLREEDLNSTPMAPTNLLYTSYLLRVAYERPFPEILGCFLPCYWIYWEVGKELEKLGSPKELFRRWIHAYSSEQYGSIVRRVLEVMDQVAQEAGENDLIQIRNHFRMTSKLEYLFWDMGFRKQAWGI